MEEKEIIIGCIKNDRKCQNLLYKLYFPLMSSIALRYNKNKDDALSCINFGFYKVLINLKSYNSDYSLSTFIRNILVRHIIDEYRKNKKIQFETINSDKEIKELNYEINEGFEKLNAEYLLNLLNKLTETTKTVFILFAIDGYKHKEISELLNISEGTSRWYVNEARKKLIEMLNDLNIKEYKAILKSQ